MRRTQVFVSYSHVDSEHLGRLKVHLRPFERKGLVDLWSDTKIKPGGRWKQEIKAAIDQAAVAILLISADFLASDFVAENELPPLLKAAEADGVKILPVVLKPCAFSDVLEVSQFQSLNNPRQPVIQLTEGEREQIWYELAIAVKNELEEFGRRPNSGGQVHTAGPIDRPTTPELWPDPAFGLFSEELGNPKVIADFIVYQYTFIDDLSYMPRAKEVLRATLGANEIINAVQKRFRDAGWEGDGEIRLMWLPPFVGAGAEDTVGVGIWFVKQSNNGISWLASPVPLPFSRLLEQNS